MKLLEATLASEHLGQSYKLWIPETPEISAGKLCVFLDAELYMDRVGTVSILSDLQAKGRFPSLAIVFVSHIDTECWRDDLPSGLGWLLSER